MDPLIAHSNVAATQIAGAESVRFKTTGRLLKELTVEDELWLPPPAIRDPESVIAAIRSGKPRADWFTFGQPIPETEPKYGYFYQRENWAVAPTGDFTDWWESLPQESRKNTRKAQKSGITLTTVPFDDALVRGIKILYDETPVRQGRRFWHYGKPIERVRDENATHLDRSIFIAATRNTELVGFMKLVRVGEAGRIMQILARADLAALHPTNALLTEAVRTCSQRGLRYLVYGQYVYGRKYGSSVTEFKRRNGFRPMYTPRYFVPLTALGRMALLTGLHEPLSSRIPEPLLDTMRRLRAWAYQRLTRSRGSGRQAQQLEWTRTAPARPPVHQP